MLNVKSKKPLYIGFFILSLYLVGNSNSSPNTDDNKNHMAWSSSIEATPKWLNQTKKSMDERLKEYIALGEDHLGKNHTRDNYDAIASSDIAMPLRNHLESIYKVPGDEVVAIVSSVLRYSHEHRVAPELVFSVIDSESSFRVDARSPVGARGLMQVLPVWHQDKIKVDGGSNEMLWRPEFNIKIGTQILREYLNRSKGNVKEALARYNGSLGANNGYPEKVLRGKERYKKYVSAITNSI